MKPRLCCHRLTILALGAAVVVIVLWLASIPHLIFLPDPLADHILRKSGHVGVYGALGWAGVGLVRRNYIGTGPALAVLVACAGVAAADESIQVVTLGRQASITDWTLDVIGAGLGILGHRRLCRGIAYQRTAMPSSKRKPHLK